ncbi:MAG: hypothetical protein AB1796_02520 [Bacillota bacterium]
MAEPGAEVDRLPCTATVRGMSEARQAAMMKTISVMGEQAIGQHYGQE